MVDVEAGDPRYDGFRITELWAAVAVDPNDDQEGILAIPGPSGPMPLVMADKARLDSMMPTVLSIAATMPQEVKLVKFTQREDVRSLNRPGVHADGTPMLCSACWQDEHGECNGTPSHPCRCEDPSHFQDR